MFVIWPGGGLADSAAPVHRGGCSPGSACLLALVKSVEDWKEARRGTSEQR